MTTHRTTFNQVVNDFEASDEKKRQEFEALAAENAELKEQLEARIQAIEFHKGDTLVVIFEDRIPHEVLVRMRAAIEDRFPERLALIFEGGPRLCVLRSGQ